MSPLFISAALDTRDLNLKERQKDHISNSLRRIQDISPKGAKISGSIKRESRLYEGNIRVSSKAGFFVAKARSGSIVSLMMRLQSKLIRQLTKWKENRFSKRERRRQLIAENPTTTHSTDSNGPELDPPYSKSS